MGVSHELVHEIERLDALIKPLGNRRVDTSDPEWEAKMRARPKPLDEAGIREEAEGALRELLALYERGDEQGRVDVRALLSRSRYFTWATGVPDGRTLEGFRQQLLYLSARDQERDVRDEIVWLNDLCREAREADVDIRALLLEVAELSSDENRHGMGSIRTLLRGAAG